MKSSEIIKIQIPKLKVASSNLVSRSSKNSKLPPDFAPSFAGAPWVTFFVLIGYVYGNS